MTTIHILFAILATIRLTQIVVEDSVFTPVRTLFKNWPQILLFFGCTRCISVWAGILMTGAYYWFPWAYWPLALSMLLQVYHMIMGFFDYLSDKSSPKITIRFGVEGHMFVDQNKITEEQTRASITRLAGMMAARPPASNVRSIKEG